MNQVNVKIQMIATLFIPTGLYAFKRIKKFTYGIIMYGICSTLYFISNAIAQNYLTQWDQSFAGVLAIIILSVLVSSLILPMLLIRKWSIDYNKKLQTKSLK